MTFRLASLVEGSNYLYWGTLQELLGEANIAFEPDASYLPYTEVIDLADGKKRGVGFASATWLMSVTPQQKYILRQICPNASADVYIETVTNNFDVSGNREWIRAQAVMNWHEGEEDIQVDKTIDLEIKFTFLVEIV